MTNATLSPFSPSAVRLLRRALTHGELWLTPSSKLVFVCGARLDAINCGRRDFLDYGKRHFPWCHFFLAEQAFEAIRRTREAVDLLTLEGYLAESADAVIIIVESDGAKAELGAFAHDDELAQITLAINDISFQDDESFICEGPIRKLDRVSKFKPMVHTRLDAIAKGLDDISDRLERIRRKYRTRLRFEDVTGFLSLARQQRLFLLADLIWLTAPIRYDELVSLLLSVLGKGDLGTLSYEIALLQALELVDVRALDEREYLLPRPAVWEPFCVFEDEGMLAIRSAFLAGYRHKDRQRLSLLGTRVAVEP